MENYENVKRSKKDMIINNLIGGIFWGIGATIGVSILIAVFGFIVGQINLVPIIGKFASEVINSVLQNNPYLLK